ncbi:AMP-binding protein [Streptomyces tendae]|uniref:AMP-binding protein n=1 Tax=Streptomyces tendae TaxID=1932 RepID=UPI0036AD04C6
MDTQSGSENYTVSVLQRLAARGDKDAIVAGERRVSGAEAVSTTLRIAAALRDLGLVEGDGVAMFVENSPEALLLQLAVHFTGCRLVFVPLEPGNKELAALIDRADVKVLIFDPALEERTQLVADLITVPHVFSIGPSSFAADFLVASSGTTELPLRDASDGRHLATILYTGGTTGLPKLVVHRKSCYDSIVQLSHAYIDDVSSNPMLLIATSITHASGHSSFLVGVLSGHTTVLLRKFDAGTALSVLDGERVTAMTVVTPMLYELLDHPDCRPGRFTALRSIIYLGASASPARLTQALERFGPVLTQLYGATESGMVTALTPQEHDLRRPQSLTSCGRPLPGVEVELRNDDGKPVATGQHGELYVRSHAVMEGYWNDPGRTVEVIDDDGWFRTGDIARQDENGYLYIVGRARDIIVTGTTADNVYARLLDDFLTAQPSIRDAATIGLLDDDDREIVHVVLVPEDPADVPDLTRLTLEIDSALGELYRPASYSFADSLPRTQIGKIDKEALRAAVLAAHT